MLSSYSLGELPTKESRIQTVQALWAKTNDFLVLIEHGHNDTFQALLEARDTIINEGDAKIIAPVCSPIVF